MKSVRQIGLGILAAAALAFTASANAQPGEGARMGHGASGQHGQGQHAAMQARMAQHQGRHGGGQQGAAAGGCPMGQQPAAQDEHKH